MKINGNMIVIILVYVTTSDKNNGGCFLLVLVLREVCLENLLALLDLAAKHKVSCHLQFHV